ncbi:hypothetical protein H6P81_010263 [Aristolochia fimbriata]|uniref:Reverse transcriptase RNase H-like domain-containing protein n=1 Tax=Aristolochia fimbriata TaxID=158543 RepID=A0AAV7ENI1_ARIFI|nr:hypothetical protein H6P81_010263 [Aristolochia fimbriata]
MKYPSWIANIVPVRKKNNQIRACVDFHDLNKAFPKDDFPLPITELMVDAMTGHEALSFMDGSSGYNKIRMDPKDEELTAFRTSKRVECYVDDLVVKTKQRSDHLLDLRAVFERLRRFQLKMNPLKCAFGVTSGKFLGFIVHPEELRSTYPKSMQFKRCRSQKHLRTQTLSRPPSIYPALHLKSSREMPVVQSPIEERYAIRVGESCWNAFNNIKAYLTKPPVLVAPIVDRPLLLYIAAQEKLVGALLAQCDKDNKERSLYYLSRTLMGAELNFTPIEKTCLALIFVIQKLRHYLLAHSTNLISRADPLKYIMSRPIFSGRLAKWALLLSEFEINYVPQRTIKGQALASFLADHPVSAEWELTKELPDEEIFLVEVLPPWEMSFDGASRRNGAGAGVFVLSYPKLFEQRIRVSSYPPRTRYGSRDELTGEFEVKKLERVPFWRHAGELLAQILEASLHYVPRSEIGSADALAGIAGNLAQFDEQPSQVPICEGWVIPPPVEKETEQEQIEEIEESLPFSASQNEAEDRREPISNFLRHGILPVDLRERVQIRRAAPKNRVMDHFCEKFCIQQWTLSAYNPAANELAEAFNKTLCKIQTKTIGANKKSWEENLGEALWAYRTSFRTPTGSTPYSLVYGTGAMLPLEVQLPSLRIALREGLTTEECAQLRLADLNHSMSRGSRHNNGSSATSLG